MQMLLANLPDLDTGGATVGNVESVIVHGQGTGHQLKKTNPEIAALILTNKKHVLIPILSLLSPSCFQAPPDLPPGAGLPDISFCFLLFFFLFSRNSRGGRGEGKREVRFGSGVSVVHWLALRVRDGTV